MLLVLMQEDGLRWSRTWSVPRLGTRPEVPAPTPETEVAVEEEEEERIDEPWRVILYNDEIHTFEEVISQLIKATGCSTGRAEELAWQVHSEGKASVYEGSFEECFRVQGVLREIQLVTEIEG